MFYEFPLTIPANTTQDVLLSLKCDMDYGIVTHVEFEFPSGCAGLAGVRVRERGHQLYPTNDGAFHVSDGHVIAFAENYKLISPPFTWFLEGYNLDDTYPHTITLRVLLVHEEDTQAQQVAGALMIPTPTTLSAPMPELAAAGVGG